MLKACIMLLFCLVLQPALSLQIYQECPVIGQHAEPAKAGEYFESAIRNWNEGNVNAAVEYYEMAVISDHSVLRYEDHGLAERLLERYRELDLEDDPSPAMLCRKAFFENVLVGNLQQAVKDYDKALKLSESDEIKELAEDEIARLKQQLQILESWQEQVRREEKIQTQIDRERYIEQTQISRVQNQISNNEAQINELLERQRYLNENRSKLIEQIEDLAARADRYRRRHYYPDSDPTFDPSSISQSPLNLYYTYRNRARRIQNQLDNIRAELTGIDRKIEQLENQNQELEQQADGSAIRAD